MKVAELIDQLMLYPLHWDVEFEGVEFYRIKQRGNRMAQIEFCEPRGNKATPNRPLDWGKEK